MKAPREQISFKTTPEELELYNFFISQAQICGKSDYIKELIKKDKRRKEKGNEKNIY